MKDKLDPQYTMHWCCSMLLAIPEHLNSVERLCWIVCSAQYQYPGNHFEDQQALQWRHIITLMFMFISWCRTHDSKVNWFYWGMAVPFSPEHSPENFQECLQHLHQNTYYVTTTIAFIHFQVNKIFTINIIRYRVNSIVQFICCNESDLLCIKKFTHGLIWVEMFGKFLLQCLDYNNNIMYGLHMGSRYTLPSSSW